MQSLSTTRTIAVMNQKGGVGKTTTVLNLGAALALAGKQVLVVDLDAQANLTRGLGLKARSLEESSYRLLAGDGDAVAVVRATPWDNLALIPSHLDLCGAELDMAALPDREARLQRALAPIVEHFDYVLVDCNPSLSLMSVNAMVACDEIFVPLTAQPFALEGLGKFLEVVQAVRAHLNPRLRISGVVVTNYDARTSLARQVYDVIRHDPRLQPHLFKTVIKPTIQIPESQRDGVPVVHFAPKGAGAKAYRALAREVGQQTAAAAVQAAQADASAPTAAAESAPVDAKPAEEVA